MKTSCLLLAAASFAAPVVASSDVRAKSIVANMTLEEKVTLLHGSSLIPWPYTYVGKIDGVKRFNIPEIKMNDGPQGFRAVGNPGSSTQFPSGLNIASSWSGASASAWGGAMSREFREKGADIQLGPGVCVARVPRCGRNFEYVSGEDPHLGAMMVAPAVKAIQAGGVLANIKHFIGNSQETHRKTSDDKVDERTLMEIYTPPFIGAVDAGVATAMCSYNLVNGEHACQNNGTLRGILRDRLGFKGWVMSDWLATHSTIESMKSGLDQEMPEAFYYSIEAIGTELGLGNIKQSEIDEKVVTILRTLDAYGVLNRTEPRPDGLHKNVTSAASRLVAHDIIVDSAVLLKNDNGFLPLSCAATRRVVVVGTEAKQASYGGGGSGAVTPSKTVTMLEGLEEVCGAGTTVEYYSGNEDLKQALAAAKDADAVVAVVGTWSEEGWDRTSLSVGQPDLPAQLAKVSNKTVAVAIVPGAVLTDFDTDVRAVLASFMPGQQAGSALAEVLFAKNGAAPRGRLPLTFPNKENEVGFTKKQWPGVLEGTTYASYYTEKLEVGYRWYHAHNVKPKYPFGHGLGYTTFSYGAAAVSCKAGQVCNVTVAVRNEGKRPGSEVVQVYVTYPAAADEPPRQLKAFAKVAFAVGESKTITLPMSAQVLSIWDVTTHAWVQPSGQFTVEVGASSQDIRSHTAFTF